MKRSFWISQALAAEVGPTSQALTSDTAADVLIVGGGFTGLWTAIELKQRQPSLDVVIIERDICGGGASGANGGFALSLWPHGPKLAAMYGLDSALSLCNAADAMMDRLVSFCEAHGIAAQVSKKGILYGITSQAQAGLWQPVVDFCEQVQVHRYSVLSKDEIRAKTGSSSFIGGVVDKNSYLLHPGQLVRGLRRVALAKGVRIYENTAMTSFSRTSRPVVHTVSGRISCRTLILAIYAWSLGVRELKSSIMAIGTDMMISEPVGPLLDRLGWQELLGIADSRNFVQSVRQTADRRVIISKAGTWLPFGAGLDRHLNIGSSIPDSEYLSLLASYYPQLKSVPPVTSWSGPIDRSMSGLPMFGRLPTAPNILYGYGYSGSGVIMSQVGAKILASLALNEDDEWIRLPVVREPVRSFPPEPVRFIGGHMVKRAIARKDRLDELGRKPGFVTNYFLKYKPGSYKPT